MDGSLQKPISLMLVVACPHDAGSQRHSSLHTSCPPPASEPGGVNGNAVSPCSLYGRYLSVFPAPRKP